MKFIKILPFIIAILIASCKSESSSSENKLEIRELTESALEEFNYNYKHLPIQLSQYRSLMEQILIKSKKIRQLNFKTSNSESLIKELKDFKLLIDKVNKHARWTDEIINKQYDNLLETIENNETDFYYQFDYLEYLIVNELLKAANYDTYRFEKVEIGFSKKLSEQGDSIEISIFPKAVIQWYNPLIIINKDTIEPNQLSKGTGKILLPKTDQIKLSGEYQMRQNFNIHIFPIDTTLSIEY